MTPKLEEIVYRNGSFPDAEAAAAGLRDVLDVADAGKESAPAVAEALFAVIDQLGNARVGVPADAAPRLTEWAERAAADPAVPASRVAFVLVNVGTAQSLEVLRGLAEGAGRKEMAAVAADFVGDHPLTRIVT